MPRNSPATELDARYSDEGATATPWADGQERLAAAELYWLSTLRATLQHIADAYESKYGSDWHFDVADGAFHHGPGEAWVFEVAPSTVYGFRKDPYSHTRWNF